MKGLTQAVISLIVYVPALLYSGFVFYKLWQFLVVPVFDIQPLDYISAVAITVFVGYLKMKKPENQEEDNSWRKFIGKAIEGVLFVLISGSVYLLVGYIISLFL